MAMDFEICGDLNFLVKDFLAYNYKSFPRVRGYVGFVASGAFCNSPAKVSTLNKKDESNKEDCED